MLVYDFRKKTVHSFDYNNEFARRQFDAAYGFVSDSLMDIPKECGCHVFISPVGSLVIASESRVSLACAMVGAEDAHVAELASRILAEDA